MIDSNLCAYIFPGGVKRGEQCRKKVKLDDQIMCTQHKACINKRMAKMEAQKCKGTCIEPENECSKCADTSTEAEVVVLEKKPSLKASQKVKFVQLE
jgi:hypothetical protein